MVDLKFGWSIHLGRGLWPGVCAMACLALVAPGGRARPQTTLEPPPNGTTATPVEAFPNVQPYDLGAATLTQTGVAAPWQTMPLPLTGAVAIPWGDGPFPVVILLHGRHPGCHFVDAAVTSQWPCSPGTETRFDLGLAYLAQALAEAGYLVLTPNLNAAYANTYGVTPENRNGLTDQRSLQIIDLHLERLAAAHRGESAGFGLSLEGQVDLTRLAFMGHSLGGGTAVLSARHRSQHASAASVTAGQGPVSALLLISPTPSRSVETEPEAYHVPDVPTSVVIGGCDRDVFDLSSLYYFETADADSRRKNPTSAVLLWGGNHNFFNAAVQQDDYYRQPDNDPLCDPQQSTLRLSRVEQESFLVQYTLDVLEGSLSPPESSTIQTSPGLDLDQGAPDHLYGFPVLTNIALPADQRWTVFSSIQTDAPAVVPQPSGQITMTDCQAFQSGGACQMGYPQFPSVLQLTWAEGGGQVQFPVGAGANLQDFHSLQLRLAANPVENPATASGFAVVLRDQSGQAVRVEVPATTPALRQLTADPTHGARHTPVYPSALRIPLGQFRGIDLGAVSSVDLIFDTGTQGRLSVAVVEFVRN